MVLLDLCENKMLLWHPVDALAYELTCSGELGVFSHA
jgi:hypothetical protein